jgi:DegV family protein with EDD domain
LKAADLRDQGLAAAEIEAQVLACVPKVHTAFVIETLDYLYMGGRASSIQHLFGSLLKLRPVIEVRPDGTLGARAKIRGSRKKALDTLLTDLADNLSVLDDRRVFVTHSGCDSDAQALAAEIRRLAPQIQEVLITTAGATISSHCGPDTIGILYLTK